MQVGLNNYQFGNSNVVARADNKKAEKKQRTNTPVYQRYQAYLKDKYPCLSASNYKVTISPAYLEKCIKEIPKKLKGWKRVWSILPISHQNMTASWKALGARVVK